MGKIIGEGITFDDVLLVPAYSEVIPNQVELKTHLTKKVHKVRGPLRGALSTAAGAADKHCPKDTRDLMDLINFMNFINSSIFTLLIKPRPVLIASRTGSRKRIAVFVRIVIPG